MDWMKKGEEFIPKYNIGELKKIYQKEKNAKAKLRLLAAILRKEGRFKNSVLLLKKFPSGHVAVYIGPDVNTVKEYALKKLENSLKAFSDSKKGVHKYFRRDRYSYSDVIWTGIELVLILLLLGVAAGVVIGFVRVFVRKVVKKKEGLEDETVIRVYIDPLKNKNGEKKNEKD